MFVEKDKSAVDRCVPESLANTIDGTSDDGTSGVNDSSSPSDSSPALQQSGQGAIDRFVSMQKWISSENHE